MNNIETMPEKKSGLKALSIDITPHVTWGVMIFISLLCFFTVYYGDIYITLNEGLILTDCIAAGRPLDFYHAAARSNVGVAAYYIPIYIIFAIWNIPVWIATRKFGIPVESLGCLLWSKAMLLVFLAGAVFLMYRIAKKLNYQNKELSAFLFVSSLMIYCPLMGMSQYDIVEILFMLWGVYFYVTDKKITPRVTLLFSIAISMKLFVIFVFLLLVLINEKRILCILFYMIESLAVSVVSMLPFFVSFSIYANSFNSEMRNRLFDVTIPGGNMGLSVFCLGFFIACIIAFLSKTKTVKENTELWIWNSALFWLIFFTFVNAAHPQWYSLFVPALILLVSNKSKLFRINMLFETFLELSYIVTMCYTYFWVFLCDGSLSSLALRNTAVAYGSGITNMKDLIDKYELTSVMNGVFALFFICGLALLVINNPWREIVKEDPHNNFALSQKTVRYIRIFFMAFFMMASIYINYD